MIDIETIKSQIVKALMPLQPEKIILFGSYAYGIPNEEYTTPEKPNNILKILISNTIK